jgi:hypothetical protein
MRVERSSQNTKAKNGASLVCEAFGWRNQPSGIALQWQERLLGFAKIEGGVSIDVMIRNEIRHSHVSPTRII